ncbi:hypothetical protein Tco_0122617 [Tanacetum coccineum]
MIPDSKETLLLAEESRSKMLVRQKDPIMLEKKVNTTPIDYAALNQLYKDFETRFVPQTELSAEQAFWSQNLVNSPEPILYNRPTIVEVPKELPKVSMVNTSLKKLKHHLAGFDMVVKERTIPTAITEALKDDLRKLKGKTLVDNDVTRHSSNPEMLKINVEPITPKLLNKQTAHSAYIKHTQEEATVLRDLVEHVKSRYPLDKSLESACSGSDPKEQGQKRVKPSTSASGSQPSGNTKKDKIQQTPMLWCMLFDNHDLCVLDFINNVNARKKSKSVNKSSKRNVWKPTRKVFSKIGYIWRPSGQTFTIVGNVCPITRITTTTEVPHRKPTALENETPKPVVTLVYLHGNLGNLKLMFLIANLRFLNLYLLTKRNPVNLGDPKFPMFHLPLLMNAGR